MASWFIEEHQRLANVMDLKSRSQLLSGTATSAVVAGRLISPLFESVLPASLID